MKNVDREQVIDLLHQAVKDRGADWVYPTKKLDHRYKADNHLTDEELGRETMACHYFATERDARILEVEQGSAMCIVGWVLDALEVTPQELKDIGVEQRDAGVSQVTASLQANGMLSFTTEAREILQWAQDGQDGGRAWGATVEVAIEVNNYDDEHEG